MSDTPAFCPNCGKPTTGNSKFCMSCGQKLALIEEQQPVQVTKTPKNNKTLMIALIAAAVIIVALGIVLAIVISNGSNQSGSSGSRPSSSNHKDDDDEDDDKKNDSDRDIHEDADNKNDKEQADNNNNDKNVNNDDDDKNDKNDDNDDDNDRPDETVSDKDKSNNNNVAYGSADIVLNQNEITGSAFYSYTAEYGHLFAFTYEEGNSGLMLTVVLPESKCVSGQTFYKQNLSSPNAMAELIMVIDGNSQVINSSDNPDLFHSMTFTLDQFSAFSSAKFTFEGEITVFDTNCTLSGQAASYYTEANNTTNNSTNDYNSQGGTTQETCWVCHGTGVCTLCDGEGFEPYTIGGQPVICNSCSGSCACKYCMGLGYIWK